MPGGVIALKEGLATISDAVLSAGFPDRLYLLSREAVHWMHMESVCHGSPDNHKRRDSVLVHEPRVQTLAIAHKMASRDPKTQIMWRLI